MPNIQQQLVGAPSMSEQELSLIYICIYIYIYIHTYIYILAIMLITLIIIIIIIIIIITIDKRIIIRFAQSLALHTFLVRCKFQNIYVSAL